MTYSTGLLGLAAVFAAAAGVLTAAGIDPQSSAVCKSPVQRRGGSALRGVTFCRSANRATQGNDGEPGTGFRAVVEVQ